MADEAKKVDFESVKNGPVDNDKRGCTDVVCCIIFILFIFACLIIAFISFSMGNPKRLAQPFDPDHKPCGIGEYEDYKFIYFVTPHPNYLYRTTCVKQCPSADPATKEMPKALDCKINQEVKSCQGNAAGLISKNYDTVVYIYDSQPMLDKMCVPKSGEIYENIKQAIKIDGLEDTISNLRNTWMIITASAFIAIIMGFIFMLIMRMFAGCVVWSFIIIIILSLALLGLFFFQQYQKASAASLANQQASNSTTTNATHLNHHYFLNHLTTTTATANTTTTTSTSTASPSTTSTGSSSTSSEDEFEALKAANIDPEQLKILAYVFFGLAALFLILTFCMCSRIRLAIAIIKCAARFIQETPSILGVPPFMFILVFIYFIYWFVVALYLYSAGDVSTEPRQFPFGQFKLSDSLEKLAWTHLFALLWNCAFFMASCQFIIMGAVCFWFFNKDKKDGALGKSIGILLKYHLGTVAFGSLLIAILQFVRILLESIKRQAQASGANQNQVTQTLIKCCTCCLYCFERFIQFVNTQAYIHCAMKGTNFCTSAADGVSLVLKNPVKIGLTKGFGALFEFLGTICICAATTFLCYTIITNTEYYQERLTSPIPSTIAFLIISFVVGSYFMGLYGTASDTIIVLHLIDCEVNQGGSPNSPDELKDFIDIHEKENAKDGSGK